MAIVRGTIQKADGKPAANYRLKIDPLVDSLVQETVPATIRLELDAQGTFAVDLTPSLGVQPYGTLCFHIH